MQSSKILAICVLLVTVFITLAASDAGRYEAIDNLVSATSITPGNLPIPGYLIIYAHDFRPEVCPELDSFIQWKLRKGLNVYTVDQNVLNIQGTPDDVYIVKECIEGWYNSTHCNPEAPGNYVLLVGDAFDLDSTYLSNEWERYTPSMCGDDSHVPTYVYGSPAAPDVPHYFSDYFYQLMNGDSIPDIVVGRWCVESQSDLENTIIKTLDYERGPNLNWCRTRALFMCQENGDFDPEHDPSLYHDAVESCIAHLPYGYDVLDRRGWNSTNAIVQADINSTQGVGILTYVGHGQYHALGTPPGWNTQNEYFKTTEIYDLSNLDRYPIMLTFCSMAGRFTWPGNDSYTECVLEAWTRHSSTSGGVAALGASAGIGGSYVLAEPYYKGLFDYKFNCGLAKNYATTYLYESGGYQVGDLQFAFGYNWIGDPELDVWRRQPVEAYFEFIPNPEQLEVFLCQLNIPHIPLPGTKVCLYREGGGYHRLTCTDEYSRAYFPYPSLTGTCHLTATNQWGDPCIIPACTSFVWTGSWPPTIPPKSEVVEALPEVVTWQLEQVSPNPMVSSVTISYSIGGAAASGLKLSIYDASGREVRVLISGEKSPGHYEVTWDGRDNSGAELSSGVYFVRMQTNTFKASQRLVLIR